MLLEGADEAVTVYEKNAKTGDRKKNTLIGYKSLDGEDADKRYIDDVHLYKLGETNFGLGAITDVNSKQTTVQIAGWDGSAVQNYERDVTADTVVFYIDTDAKTGSSTGSIRKATKWYDDADGAMITSGDRYIANALYLIKDSDDLEVLVVESGDNQFRGKYADALKETYDTTTWSGSIANVTQEYDASAQPVSLTLTTKNVPANTTVELKNAISSKGTSLTGMALTASTKVAANGSTTLSMTNVPVATVDDVITLTFTVGKGTENEFDASATITVVNKAIETSEISGATVTAKDLTTNTSWNSAASFNDLFTATDTTNATAAVSYKLNGNTYYNYDKLPTTTGIGYTVEVTVTYTAKANFKFAGDYTGATATSWTVDDATVSDDGATLTVVYTSPVVTLS